MVFDHDSQRSSRRRARRRRVLAASFAALLCTAAGAERAHARIETIRWRQPDLTDIDGWTIHVGLSSGSYSTPIDAGYPVPGGDGVFEFPIEVADDATVYVVIQSYADDGRRSPLSNEKAKSPSVTPPPTDGSDTYRLNAGGPSSLTLEGAIWSSDTAYVDGGTPSTSVRNIAGTSTPALYHTKRWGGEVGDPMTFRIPVGAGAYRVRLHFVETYEPNFAAGQRVFHVDLEGTRVLGSYDIYARVGANTAAVEEFDLNVSDGELTIDLVRVGDQTPTIAAIEVDPSDGTPSLSPPKAPILIPHD